MQNIRVQAYKRQPLAIIARTNASSLLFMRQVFIACEKCDATLNENENKIKKI